MWKQTHSNWRKIPGGTFHDQCGKKTYLGLIRRKFSSSSYLGSEMSCHEPFSLGSRRSKAATFHGFVVQTA